VFGGETTYINWALDFSPTQSVTIQPGGIDGKDTWVWAGDTSQNYGTTGAIFISADDATDLSRTYIQFDLSSISSTAVVLSSNLGLYYYHESGTSISGSVGAYQVTSSWDEVTATWDVQPSALVTPVDTVTIPASATNSFIYWDIKTLAQKWVDGSVTNNGILLMDTDEGTFEGWKGFYASEHPIDTQRPKLVIQYYDPAP
jgi:hypothetical protein